MRTINKLFLLFIGISIISCANDYEFMEDYQSQDWESSLRHIVTENMALYSNSEIYLKGYEKTDINSLSQYTFINSESRYPVMTGNKITLAPYEFIRFDTLMCHVKSSHIDNIVKNSLDHKDELVAVELQWVVKDALINTIALFDKESGELVYDNILYNTITMDAVKMNRLRRHKLTRSEANGLIYYDGGIESSTSFTGSDSFSYSDESGCWIATINLVWNEYGYWTFDISSYDSVTYCFNYHYIHTAMHYNGFVTKREGITNEYNINYSAMSWPADQGDEEYKIKYYFYIGRSAYPVNLSSAAIMPITTNDGEGSILMYSEDISRSPDYVDKVTFYCPNCKD